MFLYHHSISRTRAHQKWKKKQEQEKIDRDMPICLMPLISVSYFILSHILLLLKTLMSSTFFLLSTFFFWNCILFLSLWSSYSWKDSWKQRRNTFSVFSSFLWYGADKFMLSLKTVKFNRTRQISEKSYTNARKRKMTKAV